MAGLDEAAVREYYKGPNAHFKIPRYVGFVKDLPMNLTGERQEFRMGEAEKDFRRAEGAKV
jgi:fatty-acyl-CoA synthase